MSEQDAARPVRVRLGPIATALIEGASEPPANALEEHIERLRNDSRRIPDLEARISDQTKALADLVSALNKQNDVVSTLAALVDSRTKQLANLFLHMTTLIGTKFADGEERERLHKRLSEIAEDFEKDMQQLGTFLDREAREASRGATDLAKSIEEQALTLPTQGDRETASQQKERASGFQR